MTKQTNLRLK